MRATVVKRTSFDAAHYLPDYPGKCKQLHGHHWVVELGVSGEVNPESGMVVDFTDLGSFLAQVKANLDHKLVNKVITNPTAENIAQYISSKYYEQDWGFGQVKLEFVRVWETPDSYAEVRE